MVSYLDTGNIPTNERNNRETKYIITDDIGTRRTFKHIYNPKSVFAHQHKPLNIAEAFARVPDAKTVEVITGNNGHPIEIRGMEFQREQFNLEKVFKPVVCYCEYDENSNYGEQQINGLGGYSSEQSAEQAIENWKDEELCGELTNSYVETYWHVVKA